MSIHTRTNPLQNLTRNDAHPYGVVILAAYIGNDGFPRNNRASYHSEQKPGAGIRGVDESVLPLQMLSGRMSAHGRSCSKGKITRTKLPGHSCIRFVGSARSHRMSVTIFSAHNTPEAHRKNLELQQATRTSNENPHHLSTHRVRHAPGGCTESRSQISPKTVLRPRHSILALSEGQTAMPNECEKSFRKELIEIRSTIMRLLRLFSA